MSKWSDGSFQEKSYVNEKKVCEKTFIVKESKREDAYKKLEDRELFSHKPVNPFMIKNSYVEDLDIQDKFLIPRNSNFK